MEHNTNEKNKSDNQNANSVIEIALILALQSLAIDLDLDLDLELSAINLEFDKLYTICVTNKSTRTVKHYKNMTSVSKKLEKVHVYL